MYQFLQDEQGTAAMEYSLLISLIILVMVGTLYVLGAYVHEMFSSLSDVFPSFLVIEDSHKP